jgi:hypothetical protein
VRRAVLGKCSLFLKIIPALIGQHNGDAFEFLIQVRFEWLTLCCLCVLFLFAVFTVCLLIRFSVYQPGSNFDRSMLKL